MRVLLRRNLALALPGFALVACGAAGAPPRPSFPPSPAPTRAPSIACPQPPERLDRGEPPAPAWASALPLQPCAEPGPSTLRRCSEDGRVVVEDLEHAPHRPRRHFAPDGSLLEEWWFAEGNAQRTHARTLRGSGCVVTVTDEDGDGLVDRVCEERGTCDAGACPRSCGPYLREIAGGPCAAACPDRATRCGCDGAGRIVEIIDDEAHWRVTTSYDPAGRVTTRLAFRSEDETHRESMRYDERGRRVEHVALASRGTGLEQRTVTSTAWSEDGSSVESVTTNGAFAVRTVTDLHVPGERRVTTETPGSSSTTLTRDRGAEHAVVAFSPPMTEAWLSCSKDADCTTFVDRCDCDTPFHIGRSYLERLRKLRSARCASPSPCPDVERLPVAPKARCVASLCTASPD